MTIRSGKEESYPYSLSRWTDLPIGKWEWFQSVLKRGTMEAFDPITGIPAVWSLSPEDTLGLVFWTKDSRNLLMNMKSTIDQYNVKVHLTATGWEEVEKGAPTLEESCSILTMTSWRFGASNVTWRFSPVPLVKNAVERFKKLAYVARDAGLTHVYLSFLQENDRVPETRGKQERLDLLGQFGDVGEENDLKILLCNEDRLLAPFPSFHTYVASGVCAPPEDFALEGRNIPPAEGCGCVLMVDPFTRNETCQLGCTYCYASDKNFSNKKRNTTMKRHLDVIR